MADSRADNSSQPTRATDPMTGDVIPHKPADDSEQVYFDGSPLLRGEIVQNFLWILLGLVFIALPILWAVWKGWWWPWYIVAALVLLGIVGLMIPVLLTKTIRYRITNYRIDFERGLFSKTIDTMELWHVDDINYHQSFLARLLGIGTINVMSDDQTTPQLKLHGLPNPRPLFDTLKQRVISVKRQRGVIKMDVGN